MPRSSPVGRRHVRDLSVKQAVVGRWLFMILSVFSAVGPALIYWYGGPSDHPEPEDAEPRPAGRVRGRC